ncbi:MAG: T9SS type A sorting domain-containing protein [Flavobacteriales bacterium]|nr:T9SS type A sorting domain-containing protein [Flavobacteriales bacterium]
MRTIVSIAFIVCAQLIGTAQNWVPQASNTLDHLQAIYFVDSLHGCAVGNNGTIRTTTDGGSNWIARPSGTPDHILSVHFIDPLKGFASTSSSLLRTTDGGLSWTIQHSLDASLDPIFFLHPDTGFVGGRTTLLRTTDGGTTWAERPSGPISPTCMWAHSAETLFLGGWGGANASEVQLLRSADGGITWITSYDQGAYGPLNDVFFTDEQTGYIAFSYFGQGVQYDRLMKTLDGGTTWEPILSNSGTSSSPSPTAAVTAIHFVSDQNGYIATQNGSILVTVDAGATWEFQVNGAYPSFNDIFFVDALNGWVVGNEGTILKLATDVSVNGLTPGTGGTPMLYPNPISQHELYIDTDRSILSIDLFGTAGQFIRSYASSTTVIDVGDLAPGVYVLKVKTDAGVNERAFIKQ